MRLRNFQQFQKKIQKNLNKNMSRVADIVDEVSMHIDIKEPRKILNFALGAWKPFIRSLGLRVAFLNEEQIEVVVPEENLSFAEGALCSAAIYAFHQLWAKNAPKQEIEVDIQHLNFEKHRPFKGDLFVRCELPKLLRESIYVELSDIKKSFCELALPVYDHEKLLVAEINIKAQLQQIEKLEWK